MKSAHPFAIHPVLLALLVLLAPTGGAGGQQLRLDPATDLMLLEIGAIVSADGDALTVATVLPTDFRPAESRDVDVREGDVLLMIAGERVHEIQALRERYDRFEVGAEIKLGLRRGDERFLVKFPKVDQQAMMNRTVADGHGGGVRMMHLDGGGDQDLEVLVELRALITDGAGELRVDDLFGDSDLQEGDVIEAVNDRQVDSLEDLRDAYQAIAIGDEIRLRLRRGGATVEAAAVREEHRGRVMRIGGEE